MRKSREASEANRASKVDTVWWLNPCVIFVLIGGGTMLAAVLTPDKVYQESFRTAKYLGWHHLGLAAFAGLAFWAGAAVAGSRPQRTLSLTNVAWDRRLRTWFYGLSALGLGGYLFWVALAVTRGLTVSLVLEMFFNPSAEASETMKLEILRTAPVWTTCAQFSIAAVVLGTWLALRRVRGILPLLSVILLLGLIRALLRSERLAFLEMAIPCSVLLVRARWLGGQVARWFHVTLRIAPIIGLLFLVLIFGVSEYFRSWQFYRQREDSFASFLFYRMSAYYTTCHNNSAMALETWSRLPLPYYTLEAYWKFPLVRNTSLSYESLAGVDPEQNFEAMLERYGSPEYNNPGGLLTPLLDYGMVGFAVFWFAYGWGAGWTYGGFLRGSAGGLISYPIILLSLVEVPRILYLFDSRTFPPLIALLAMGAAFAWYRPGRTQPAMPVPAVPAKWGPTSS